MVTSGSIRSAAAISVWLFCGAAFEMKGLLVVLAVDRSACCCFFEMLEVVDLWLCRQWGCRLSVALWYGVQRSLVGFVVKMEFVCNFL